MNAMLTPPRRLKRGIYRYLSPGIDWIVASIVIAFLKLIRLLPPDRVIRGFAAIGRRLGRFLAENRVAEANLAAAFPQMDDASRRALARQTWGHLGRLGAEYAFLDKIFDFDPDNPGTGRFEVVGAEKFQSIRDRGKPAILFTGHLANFEILAVCAAKFDLGMTSMFRPPNNQRIARNLFRARKKMMENIVPSMTGAAYQLGHVLEQNGRVGVLIDQYFRRGPMIRFFGRPTPTNPLLGVLARRHQCEVYGARCIRLPGERFRLELTGPYDLPRDKSGEIDVNRTMQLVTSVLEEWVREYPAQWLWAHRRWR